MSNLKDLNLLLVGETSHLGVVLRERDGSDSPNNYLQVILLNSNQLEPNFKGVGFINDLEFATLNVTGQFSWH